MYNKSAGIVTRIARRLPSLVGPRDAIFATRPLSRTGNLNPDAFYPHRDKCAICGLR